MKSTNNLITESNKKNTEITTKISKDMVEKSESVIFSENITTSSEKIESNSLSGSDVIFFSEEESKKLQKEDENVLKEIKYSLTNIEKHKSEYKSSTRKYNLQLVLEVIKLGIKLVEFKKQLGSRFFTVVNKDVLNSKLIYSYIRLVMTKESQKDYDTSIKGKKENPELIVIDERIVSFLDTDSSKMVNPSINKVTNMKPLSDEDFWEVVDGR